MSLQVEKLEKNMAKLTIEVPSEQFVVAMGKAFNKSKGRFNIPGFRKGKVPQAMVEKMYGPEVLYEDAANIVMGETYPDALKESGLDVVARPDVDVEQVEKGKPFIYVATVALKPEVTLGDYKGVEVEKVSAEVTDADVEAELKKAQESNSRTITVEDRAIQDGDIAVIDYEGSVDGEAFEGGKGENQELVIGSHSFIDNFEEQLIGRDIGETLDVKVTFPGEYHAKELAGKQALFRVKINGIKFKELPELDDEFADEVSEFDTLAEYREDIRKGLLEARQKEAAAENENRVIQKVVENATLEIPDPMVEAEAERLVNGYKNRVTSQGLPFEMFLKYMGMTEEGLLEQYKGDAEKNLRTRLVLEQVVKQEDIKVSDETLDREVEKLAQSYKMDADALESAFGEGFRDRMRDDLNVQEAVDWLVSEAKLV
ncbi:MAG: trigger factor [Lachnospiraceae bacterium]|jgi:trigger factor|nr:trigger factor [Lachnospiraceae bacterium]